MKRGVMDGMTASFKLIVHTFFSFRVDAYV